MDTAPARGIGTRVASLLARPRSVESAPAQAVLLLACSAVIGTVGYAEWLWPSVPLGAFRLLAVFLGAWLLGGLPATVVIVEGVVAPLASSGPTPPGEVRAAGALILGLVMRVAVVNLLRSRAEIRQQAEEVARLNRSLERFTADAAHELRAPLALIRSELDMVGAERPGPRLRHRLQRIGEEVDRMTRLTSALLTLSQADTGTLRRAEGLRDVDLVDLVELVASRWSAVAERHGVEVRTELPDAGTVNGDPDLLVRLLDNLVDNALRHAAGARSIVIAAREGPEGWSLSVTDDGPGVPEAIRETIFDRFVRGDRGRAARSGTGLGLALCAAIAAAHAGSLVLEDAPGGGARFVLRAEGGGDPADPEPRGGRLAFRFRSASAASCQPTSDMA